MVHNDATNVQTMNLLIDDPPLESSDSHRTQNVTAWDPIPIPLDAPSQASKALKDGPSTLYETKNGS
jgi:hypothetical protein